MRLRQAKSPDFASVNFLSLATLQEVLRMAFAKCRPCNLNKSERDASDWSAAVNAALMLPAGALVSLIFHPLLSRPSSPSTTSILVGWQPSTPSSAAPHYVLGVIFCFLLATWAAMHKPIPIPRLAFGRTVSILLALSSAAVISISLLCQLIIYQDGQAWPAWVGLAAYVTFLWWCKRGFSTTATGANAGEFFVAESQMTVPASRLGYAGDLCAMLLIFLVFWPYSIDALSAHWHLQNPHAISYLIGPAQLSQVPGNLPNVNFFSQYSIGIPYAFSALLSSDLVVVIERYLYAMTMGTVLYTGAFYFLSSRLYASRFWGFAFTLLMVVLLANAIFWTEPSSSPTRFLLFPFCGIILLNFGLNSRVAVAVAGVFAALSIMNNTETGVHTTIAYACVLCISGPSWQLFFRRLALLVAATIAAVTALFVLCCGWEALSVAFLVGNLEPLVVYSVVGYGNYPLPWNARHWTWMQCLVMPGLATLLLALSYYKTWTNRGLSRGEQAIVFCSAFGLLLLVKFMYRSYMALGHVNSGPLIVILGFWFVFVLRKTIKLKQWAPSVATVVGFAVWLSTLASFLYTFRENDQRDIKYATTWLYFPSVFNRITGMVSGELASVSLAEQAAKEIDDVDVALIKRYSEPASRPVWIYADEDWAYLLRAARKPATTVLPVPHILMGRDLHLLKAKFNRDAPAYVFVEKKHQDLMSSDRPSAVFPDFAQRYTVVDAGNKLAVYKRKSDQ
jgi:hypothetical protein